MELCFIAVKLRASVFPSNDKGREQRLQDENEAHRRVGYKSNVHVLYHRRELGVRSVPNNDKSSAVSAPVIIFALVPTLIGQ